MAATILLWALTLISIDRHRRIAAPPYRSKIAPRQAFLLSGTLWLITSITLLPVAFWFKSYTTTNGNKICTVAITSSNIIRYSIIIYVPIILILYVSLISIQVYKYCQIFNKILSTRSAWASSCVVVSTIDMKGSSRSEIRRQSEISLSEILTPWTRKFSSSHQSTSYPMRHGSMSHQEEIRFNKRVKVIRTLSSYVIMLLVMWLPITIIPSLIFFDSARSRDDKTYFLRSSHLLIALALVFSSTIVNPVLFCIFSDNLKLNFLQLFNCNKHMKRVISLRNNGQQCTDKKQMTNRIRRKDSLIENGNSNVSGRNCT